MTRAGAKRCWTHRLMRYTNNGVDEQWSQSESSRFIGPSFEVEYKAKVPITLVQIIEGDNVAQKQNKAGLNAFGPLRTSLESHIHCKEAV